MYLLLILNINFNESLPFDYVTIEFLQKECNDVSNFERKRYSMATFADIIKQIIFIVYNS